MARKELITKSDIRAAAFEMARKLGVVEITARKLASYAGCSTQPIFRNYENMEDCLNDVYEDYRLVTAYQQGGRQKATAVERVDSALQSHGHYIKGNSGK